MSRTPLTGVTDSVPDQHTNVLGVDGGSLIWLGLVGGGLIWLGMVDGHLFWLGMVGGLDCLVCEGRWCLVK